LQLPSQVGSFVHAIIIAVQLAHLWASSWLIQSFTIIIAIKLTCSCDHHRDQTAFLRLSSQWMFVLPLSPQNLFVQVTLVAIKPLVCDQSLQSK
jgi:hypothetical protein